VSRGESYVLYGFVLLVVAIGFWRFHEESVIRRDQNCLSFERQERQARNQLDRNLDFLGRENKTPTEIGIVRLVKTNLPLLRDDVKANKAPAYCDKPGVGLPDTSPAPSRGRPRRG
jgi:hypothetical protein